jgi:putative restriction endonuclease
MVLDAYERRCAITGERALPVLHAAHIRPFSVTERHDLGDAVLLRSDIHALLDAGYITITPELRVQLSPRFALEFGTESDYLQLNGTRIHAA